MAVEDSDPSVEDSRPPKTNVEDLTTPQLFFTNILSFLEKYNQNRICLGHNPISTAKQHHAFTMETHNIPLLILFQTF